MKYLRSKIFGYRDPDSVALRSWQDILTLHRGDHRKAVHTLLTQWGVPRWTFWRDFAVVDLEGSGLEYPALIVDIRTGRTSKRVGSGGHLFLIYDLWLYLVHIAG
jgi:hypothetical protein